MTTSRRVSLSRAAAVAPASVRRRADAAAPAAAGLAVMRESCRTNTTADPVRKLPMGRRGDPLEQVAERVADRVMALPSSSVATAAPAVSDTQAQRRQRSGPSLLPGAAGHPLDRDTRSFMEARFGHDFGAVRVHTDGAAAATAAALQARAYTVGQDMAFGLGHYAPYSSAGRRLIAHELAHTVQQRRMQPLIQRDDDEAAKKKQQVERERAKKRLETWAAGQTPKPSTDPSSKDFAMTAQQLGNEITHKPAPDSSDLLEKPSDKTKQANWTTAFRDAYQLALMILDTQGTDQREIRAALIASDLATAGFTTEAMDVAGKLPDDNKENVYESVAASADQASADQIRTLSTFFAARKASPGDHPLLAQLTDRSGAFARKLGNAKLLAALEPTLPPYRKDTDYRDALAQILVFDPASRVAISEWLWQADKEYLFEILNTKVFVEPGYGVEQLADASGKPRELTMDADLPWVYAYKQKFYTDYLVKLGAKHTIDIKAPTNLKFAALKAWLDAQTEHIGQALAAEHPNAPEKVTEAYQHMADIFFFHVDRGDVVPNRAGKLGHLVADAPRAMRLKSDCDVLATYATRLLRSAGFTPVGYLAVEPDTGPSHAVALLKKAPPAAAPAAGQAPVPGPDRYYIVNNKQVTPNDAADKEAAIKAARDDSLGVYDPEPNAYRIYYEDAGADGSMTKDLWTTEETVRRKDLGKDAPAVAPSP